MNSQEILTQLNHRIGELQQARSLLTGSKLVDKAPRKHRTMSPEGRARIAAAQKARWAKTRK